MPFEDAEQGNSDRILVAIQNERAFVRVLGRGNYRNSPALKAFGRVSVERGVRRFYLDMHNCTGMDSTFMGVLVGLESWLRRQEGELVMIHLSSRLSELLVTLGLDHVITFYLEEETPADIERMLAEVQIEGQELDAAAGTDTDARRTMLEAHEALIDLAPQNAPRFHDVLTFLRQDLPPDESGGRNGEVPS